jgi:hypothetical protein
VLRRGDILSAIHVLGRASEIGPVQQRPFDAALWKDPQDVEFGRTSRSEMVDDLLAKHDFSGQTCEEVEALLGPAEEPPEWEDRWDFVYYLGFDRSFAPIDNEWLGFALDVNGRVEDVCTFID